MSATARPAHVSPAFRLHTGHFEIPRHHPQHPPELRHAAQARQVPVDGRGRHMRAFETIPEGEDELVGAGAALVDGDRRGGFHIQRWRDRERPGEESAKPSRSCLAGAALLTVILLRPIIALSTTAVVGLHDSFHGVASRLRRPRERHHVRRSRCRTRLIAPRRRPAPSADRHRS
jgi:hypothetical protein